MPTTNSNRACSATRRIWSTSDCWVAILIVAFVAVLFSCLCPADVFGAERKITLRFLDPKSGTPIRKMWVNVFQYKGNPPKGPVPAEYVMSSLSLRTDRNGEIAATLHNPLPTYVGIQSFDLAYNGPLISIDDVLKSGVIVDHSSKGAPQGYWTDNQGHRSMRSGSLLDHSDKKWATTVNPVPEPGVIVFVEKRITTGERIRQEIP